MTITSKYAQVLPLLLQFACPYFHLHIYLISFFSFSLEIINWHSTWRYYHYLDQSYKTSSHVMQGARGIVPSSNRTDIPEHPHHGRYAATRLYAYSLLLWKRRKTLSQTRR